MSWTMTAHAVMPACALTAPAWPDVAAARPVPAGPGLVGSLPTDRPAPGLRYPLNGPLIPEGTPYAYSPNRCAGFPWC